jgi:probable rRNA maturation factor
MIENKRATEPPGRDGRAAVVPFLAVDIGDPDGLLSPSQGTFLRGYLRAAGDHLSLTGDVRIRILNDAEMSGAHERFCQVSGTTDVLTFDLRSQAECASTPAAMDVDILVCIDEARRAAATRGHTPEQELLLYALHGLLHCLGHDDHDDAAYARMHALEDQVLAAIGVGPVFAGTAEEGGR